MPNCTPHGRSVYTYSGCAPIAAFRSAIALPRRQKPPIKHAACGIRGGGNGSPAHIIQIHFGVVSEAALVGPTAVIVLHSVGIEGLDLAVVLGDDELH